MKERNDSGPRTGWTIVVGVDASPGSVRAWQAAVELALAIPQAELIAVFARYVYLAGPPGMDEAMFGDVLASAEHEARRQAAKIVGEAPIRWRFEAHGGDPSTVLRDVAEKHGARLLFCGKSGWSTMHELFVGTVSNRLAHDSPCPIVLVS